MSSSVQQFYDEISGYYHLIFEDWDKSIERQSIILDSFLAKYGISREMSILDCACGIGTQTLGLAELGYLIIGSDLSPKEIERAKKEAKARNIDAAFYEADFCFLSDVFDKCFHAIIAIDNALPHITERPLLEKALSSIHTQIEPDGVFVASIRDYDEILRTKPSSPPPYIIKTALGKRIAFQLWEWNNDIYDFTQYIITDESNQPQTLKFSCKYRAITRSELTNALRSAGFQEVEWVMPEKSKFYQPIVIARKR